MELNKPTILAVCRSGEFTFHKPTRESITLLEGLGIEGDIHKGKTVRHRSRMRKDPTQINLRQVHLIQSELHEELNEKGFHVNPGEMGENITTSGLSILDLPRDTILHLGDEAQIRVTGLRNPCSQLDNFQPGLMKAVLDKDEDGNLIRKCGIMSTVLKGGVVRRGDEIRVQLPAAPHLPLEKV